MEKETGRHFLFHNFTYFNCNPFDESEALRTKINICISLQKWIICIRMLIRVFFPGIFGQQQSVAQINATYALYLNYLWHATHLTKLLT